MLTITVSGPRGEGSTTLAALLSHLLKIVDYKVNLRPMNEHEARTWQGTTLALKAFCRREVMIQTSAEPAVLHGQCSRRPNLTQAQADFVFQEIEHGDVEHRAWLRASLNGLVAK